MNLKETIYHGIHKNGLLANLAYKSYRYLYEAKEVLTPPSAFQKPDDNGLYAMPYVNIAITAICNAKCIFCAHRHLENPTSIMPQEQFEKSVNQWELFGGNKQKALSLTPGVPPGDPLCDPGLESKALYAKSRGYQVEFITNAILLHKWTEKIFQWGNVNRVGISFPSFNEDIYKELYGVDRGRQVTNNIFNFLELNRSLGWPVKCVICFRSKETPRQVMAHPNYQKLIPFFNEQFKVMFTTWWDDWNGVVSHEEMERGEIKIRKPLNLKRACQGAISFSLRPEDRLIRLCGCRFVPNVDDMVVGDIDTGFHQAQIKSFEIQDNFKRGIRTKTCTNCGAYKQA